MVVVAVVVMTVAVAGPLIPLHGPGADPESVILWNPTTTLM